MGGGGVMSSFEKFFRAYVACALWSSTDEANEQGGSMMDGNYDIDDINSQSLEEMRADCLDFWEAQSELLEGLDPEQCGHDFWLTRNGHGAGFWDRGLEELGDKLSEACRPYGECYLYVGDDGEVYRA